MPDRLKKLERELGLPPSPPPFALDETQICRRVEGALSARGEERKRYMRHKTRLAAVLAAAAVVLAGTAIAAGPLLGEALQRALGGFAPYAQTLEGTATDQGIRVRVLSALADSTTVKVYAEVTDLEGDRLANASIHGWVNIESDADSSIVSLSGSLLSYDPQAKTALMVFSRSGSGGLTDQTSAVLEITGIQPEYYSFETDPIPVEAITSELLATQVLSTGETVLAPGQNPLELGKGGGVSLSSAGFAADGRLHFLFCLPDGADPERSSVLLTAYSKSWREGDGPDLKFNQDMQRIAFLQDGAVYYDLSVTAVPDDLPDLLELTGAYGSYICAQEVEGTWEIPVAVTPVEEHTSPLTGTIDHSTLLELSLSPLGVILRSSSPDMTQIGGYPLTVFLADGTRLHPASSTVGAGSDLEVHLARWEFEHPVELEQITGVALGCWMIPVENGVAGEGYWLAALPE